MLLPSSMMRLSAPFVEPSLVTGMLGILCELKFCPRQGPKPVRFHPRLQCGTILMAHHAIVDVLGRDRQVQMQSLVGRRKGKGPGRDRASDGGNVRKTIAVPPTKAPPLQCCFPPDPVIVRLCCGNMYAGMSSTRQFRTGVVHTVHLYTAPWRQCRDGPLIGRAQSTGKSDVCRP